MQITSRRADPTDSHTRGFPSGRDKDAAGFETRHEGRCCRGLNILVVVSNSALNDVRVSRIDEDGIVVGWTWISSVGWSCGGGTYGRERAGRRIHGHW